MSTLIVGAVLGSLVYTLVFTAIAKGIEDRIKIVKGTVFTQVLILMFTALVGGLGYLK